MAGSKNANAILQTARDVNHLIGPVTQTLYLREA
jgi:hypothetical protein